MENRENEIARSLDLLNNGENIPWMIQRNGIKSSGKWPSRKAR